MKRKSQLGLEYLLIIAVILTVVGGYSYYSETIQKSQNVEYSVDNILNQMRSAAQTVSTMGYPARQSFEVYVPENIDPNNTYIKNNTVNYAVYGKGDKSADIYDAYDYCVRGNLPTSEGYHTITVMATTDCVIVNYQDAYIEPQSITKTYEVNTTTNASVEFNALVQGTTNITLTVNGSIASMTDVDPSIPGRQSILYLGEYSGGEVVNTSIIFYGDEIGTYTGYLYFNEYRVSVTLIITSCPPAVNNTSVNITSIDACDTVCIIADAYECSYPISSVWTELIDWEGEITSIILEDIGCSCCGTTDDNIYGAAVSLCTECCNYSIVNCSECNYNNTDCDYENKTSNYHVEYEAEPGKYDEVKLEARNPGLGDGRIYETDTIIIEVNNSNDWVNTAMKSVGQGDWYNFTEECETYYDNITGFRMTLVDMWEGVCGESVGTCNCTCDEETGCSCQCSGDDCTSPHNCGYDESQCSFSCQNNFRCRCRCRGDDCECDCGYSENNCTYYTFEITSDCNKYALSNIYFEFGDGAVVENPTTGSYKAQRVCGAGEDFCSVAGCPFREGCFFCSCEEEYDEEDAYLVWTVKNSYANDTSGYTVMEESNIKITTECENT